MKKIKRILAFLLILSMFLGDLGQGVFMTLSAYADEDPALPLISRPKPKRKRKPKPKPKRSPKRRARSLRPGRLPKKKPRLPPRPSRRPSRPKRRLPLCTSSRASGSTRSMS